MKGICPLLAAILTMPLAAAAQNMQPGEWEFHSTMSSPMFPKPQSGTVKQCISKEDAADPTRFASNEKMQGCIVKPGVKGAGSYKWEISCPAQGLSGNGSVRYTNNSMDAEIRMLMDMQGQKTEMISKVTGRFVGPCKPK